MKYRNQLNTLKIWVLTSLSRLARLLSALPGKPSLLTTWTMVRMTTWTMVRMRGQAMVMREMMMMTRWAMVREYFLRLQFVTHFVEKFIVTFFGMTI